MLARFFDRHLCRRGGIGVFGTDGKAPKALLAQMLANRALMELDAKFDLNTAHKIGSAPAHHTVTGSRPGSTQAASCAI